jgi:hypothetical protein
MNIANSVLAFALEVVLWIALGLGAWRLGPTPALRILFALVVITATLIVWGRWLAPRSAERLNQPRRVVLKLALFAVGAACLYVTGHPVWTGALTVLVLINQALEYTGHEIDVSKLDR